MGEGWVRRGEMGSQADKGEVRMGEKGRTLISLLVISRRVQSVVLLS